MRTASLIAAATLTAAMALPAEAAPAKRPSWQTYVGLSYQGMILGHGARTDIPNKLSDGMNIHIGERYGNLAAEISYSRSEALNQVTTGTTTYQTKMAISGPTLDLIGYLPIGAGFSLAASGGVSLLTGKGSNFNPASPFTVSKTEIGGRAGGGFEWRMMEPLSLNVMARYQTAGFNGLAKGGIVYTAGFNFYF